MRCKRLLSALLVVAVAAALVGHATLKQTDFRVYYHGARGFFDGTRPMYGPESGLGWPMHYRYPPLFLFLFYPWTRLPIGLAAAAWALLKLAALAAFLRAVAPRLGTFAHPLGWIVPVLAVGPFIVEEMGYGNVQLLVVVLVAVGLVCSRTHPVAAPAALALAAAIKVWPLFFVPWLVARRDLRQAALTLGLAAALTLLPALGLGLDRELELLREWRVQETATQLGEQEIWFPSQSLRGVLMRWLTAIDYSKLPDAHYRQVHLASLDPALVSRLAEILSGLGYAGLLGLAWRGRHSDGWADHGVASCGLAALQPFTQRTALVVLLLPALVAGSMASSPATPPWRKVLIAVACAIAVGQPLAPGAELQRLLHVLGLDLVAIGCLSAALWGATLPPGLADPEPARPAG